MYDINSTITAISSAAVDGRSATRSIVRISGRGAFDIISSFFCSPCALKGRQILRQRLRVDGLELNSLIYIWPAGNSYTGEDVVEIHLVACESMVELFMQRLCEQARLADPGEFTLRAYLNGRMDLSQAEAVAEIVSSSNRFQLAAAERLLAGKLSETISSVRNRILDLLSLVEAGLDFSAEDIEFISSDQARTNTNMICEQLLRILQSHLKLEELLDLPSVGLAGVANSGKSSLLNKLLGQERSIVSSLQATTRDVLTGLLESTRCTCVLFDCAGLQVNRGDISVLHSLAQEAALEALSSADMVLFCIDVNKENFAEDFEIKDCIDPRKTILAATKCDLLTSEALDKQTQKLKDLFGTEPIVTSALTGDGVKGLQRVIEEAVTGVYQASETVERIAVTERHRQVLEKAIKGLSEAADEFKMERDEIAVMLLRGGYQELAGLEFEAIDEKILEKIFSSFCIGK